MPDPKDNAKATGDTHPPEVESDLPMQEGADGALGADGTPRDRGRATESGKQSKPGRGIKQAGLLKDKDDETSDSYGNKADSGEGSSGGRKK
jgi:hypothetical protein